MIPRIHRDCRPDPFIVRRLAAGGLSVLLCAACAAAPGAEATRSARSVAALITEMAARAPSPTPTSYAPADAPTATIGPTPSPVTPTAIPTVELASPTPKVVRATFSGPTPTTDAASLLTRTLTGRCSAAFFVGYAPPVFLDSEVKVESSFVVTWVIRNVGTCTWYPGYFLHWHSGAHFEGPDYIDFPEIVPPNQNLLLSLTLTAPREPGKYYSRWYLRDPEMAQFGIGENFDQPLMIRITAVA
jgi:hypothetical protein